MDPALVIIVFSLLVIGGALFWSRQQATERQEARLNDAKAESRRWTERLGGQVLNLVGSNEAAKQALADASERHAAASSQLDQAHSVDQCKLATQSALEGLYYVRGARVAMDMDPGPDLPDLSGQHSAGKVTEFRSVDVEGREQVASPEPTEQTPHFYPGGQVAGRPVPQGWYSEPWWKPALVAGAWGMGSFMLMSAMFTGMAGVPTAATGADSGGEDPVGDGGDVGGDMGDGSDGGGFDFGEGGGGFDFGEGGGGFDFGDFGF